MATLDFKLPDVGEGLAEGEIVRWHAKPGEAVHEDQILVEVETDKAIVEIPAPATGTLTVIGAQAGETLAVGAVLATFEVADTKKTRKPDVVKAPAVSKPGRSPARASGRVLASPAIRKAARELGVDLSAVTGSGSRGQIVRSDLDAAAMPVVAAAPAPVEQQRKGRVVAVVVVDGEDRIEPLRGLRRRIAQTMEQAWREIPHIFNLQDIDATQLVAARSSLNDETGPDGPKLSFMPFLVKACVLALKAHPSFNASLDTTRDEIIYRHRYNVGIATATDDGLMVPVLHDADRLSLPELAHQIAILAEAARTRRASVAQLSHGTFTVSNFGAYGAGIGMPIIRPPEVAIAGFGRIRDGVVAENGTAVVRPILPVIVSTDHRLNDGQNLGAFFDTLAAYLREPVRLLAHD